jgi:hypothetical protein
MRVDLDSRTAGIAFEAKRHSQNKPNVAVVESCRCTVT